jgi:hypothetical protein
VVPKLVTEAVVAVADVGGRTGGPQAAMFNGEAVLPSPPTGPTEKPVANVPSAPEVLVLRPLFTIPIINVLVVAEIEPPVTPVAVSVEPLDRPDALMLARIPLIVIAVSAPVVAVKKNVTEFVPEPTTFRPVTAAPLNVPTGGHSPIFGLATFVRSAAEHSRTTGRGKVLMLSGVAEVATNTVLAGFSVRETLACVVPIVPAVHCTVTSPVNSTVASERTCGEVLTMLPVVHCAKAELAPNRPSAPTATVNNIFFRWFI